MPGTACGLSMTCSQHLASVLPELDIHGLSPLRPANGLVEAMRELITLLQKQVQISGALEGRPCSSILREP